MNLCQNCGVTSGGDAQFCEQCGASLQAVSPAATVAGQPSAGTPCILLGSHPACDVSLAAGSVSGVHALAWLQAGDLWLADLASTNGTLANGTPLTLAAPVPPGAVIQLGRAVTVGEAALRHHLQAGRVGLLVGRDSSSDHVVDQPTVSSRHLLVCPAPEEAVAVVDLGSANGTFIGQARRPLRGGVLVAKNESLYLGSLRLPLGRLIGAAAVGAPPTAVAPAAPAKVNLSTQPILLGRDPSCDVCLALPQVSARHARLTCQAGGNVLVEDLGSTNGTFVNGARITQAVLQPGGTLSLGSHPIQVDAAGVVQAQGVKGSIRLDAMDLVRVVTHRETKQPLTLLDKVSVSIYPSELVGLMGGSGAGKTTMMLSLNGYEKPTSGRVYVNGEDLYANYDRFRGLIGYLPQDDIIHGQLTVAESLYFTARLRLPSDTTEHEIEQRITRVLDQLKLTNQKDQLIGTTDEKVLSGGQRKRVNLAQELVTDPVLLFLDEPTSGLSSQDTDDVMDVLRGLADDGHTIVFVLHQPSREVFGRMDHVLFLAKGGRLAYFGPTSPDSYDYFQVSERKPGELVKQVQAKPAQDLQKRYLASEQHRRYVQERLGQVNSGAAGAPQQGQTPRARPRQPWLVQLLILLRRFALVKCRNRSNLLFMAMQPLVVGILTCLVSKGTDNIISGRGISLFLVCIAAVFFGSFNAARDIVNERGIYLRERMVSLMVVPYVLSKFIFLGVLGVAQVLILFGITKLGVELEGSTLEYLGILSLTMLAAIAMGLVISAAVRSAQTANALVPMILIPQIMLGGVLVRLSPPKGPDLAVLAAPMVSRWSYEALLEIERPALAGTDLEFVNKVPTPGGGFRISRTTRNAEEVWSEQNMTEKDLTPARLRTNVGVLLLFIFVLLGLCVALVRFRDPKT